MVKVVIRHVRARPAYPGLSSTRTLKDVDCRVKPSNDNRPHAEERRLRRVPKHVIAAILRDAAPCAAPQDEGQRLMIGELPPQSSPARAGEGARCGCLRRSLELQRKAANFQTKTAGFRPPLCFDGLPGQARQ